MSDRALSPRQVLLVVPVVDRSQPFDATGRDVLGWVGVAVDVPLGLVAQSALQFVGVVARLGCQGESDGVPEVVGAQWADVAVGVGFTVVSAPYLFADQVDRARGQSPVGSAGADRGRGQEQGGGVRARVGGAFALEVVGARWSRCPAVHRIMVTVRRIAGHVVWSESARGTMMHL